MGIRLEVPGAPGYEVADDGSVWCSRNRAGKVTECFHHLNPWRGSTGYLAVAISPAQGAPYLILVHRLVAKVFIPNPSGHPVVNHINGDRADNRVENLEWVSRAGNRRHAAMVGGAPSGESHPNAKLTEEQVATILRRASDGPINFTATGLEFGVSRTTISHIVNGKGWDHNRERTHSSPSPRPRGLKLTVEDVQGIRDALSDKTPHRAIAATYGVSRGLIAAIASGKTWKSMIFRHPSTTEEPRA